MFKQKMFIIYITISLIGQKNLLLLPTVDLDFNRYSVQRRPGPYLSDSRLRAHPEPEGNTTSTDHTTRRHIQVMDFNQ